jgi:hypothetical protein
MKANNNCIKTSSNCIVWDGPNIDCLKLCKGDSITDVLYKLAKDHCDLLKQLDPLKYDLSCLDLNSCPPETFRELFQLIISKICELENLPEPAPPALPEPGIPGKNGDKLEVTTLAIGSVLCPCGGVTFKAISGTDSSVINESTICNGCNGTAGTRGDSGLAGTTGNTGLRGEPGIAGTNGSPGKSGRGVAVFSQTAQPTSANFTALYGTTEGFGTNFITGNNQIKPGDIWIEPCTQPA